MARRMLVLTGLAVSIAGISVAVVALSHGTPASRPSAQPGDVYSRLARQLKQHIKPLVPAVLRTPQALNAPPPAVQRQLQQNGYSCAVATSTGCSLHPCIEYAQSATVPPNGAVVSPAAAPQCRSKANALPRAIPITGP